MAARPALGKWVQPNRKYKTQASDKTYFNLCPFSLVLPVGWEESGSLFLSPSCQIFAHIDETSPDQRVPSLPTFSYRRGVPIPSPSLSACARIVPGGPHLTCTWGDQNWTWHSRYVSPVLTKMFCAAQNTDG